MVKINHKNHTLALTDGCPRFKRSFVWCSECIKVELNLNECATDKLTLRKAAGKFVTL